MKSGDQTDRRYWYCVCCENVTLGLYKTRDDAIVSVLQSFQWAAPVDEKNWGQHCAWFDTPKGLVTVVACGESEKSGPLFRVPVRV